MHLIFENLNHAFMGIVSGIHRGEISTEKVPTRNGPAYTIQEPVIITYERPLERVLMNPHRNANPFFHLFESLWMLAGRNDVAPLAYYAANIANYSDNGVDLNGAYGYRWRMARSYEIIEGPYYDERVNGGLTGPGVSVSRVKTTNIDQLDLIVAHLKAKPESRRAVLQMWNVEDDLLHIDDSKDVCCNLSVMLSLREEKLAGGYEESGDSPYTYLDMTVTNRSNDLIWGTMGANAVHFSVLLEYMAARLGVQVGKYNQFSTNQHAYESNWEPDKWLDVDHVAEQEWIEYPYKVFPLVSDPGVFDREVAEFVDNQDWTRKWEEPFLDRVASPMCWAWRKHKAKDYTSALKIMYLVEGEDWRKAGTEWLGRARDKYIAKEQQNHVRKTISK